MDKDETAVKVGRPLKYGHFVSVIDDTGIYTPAAIVREAETKGLLDHLEEDSEERAMEKLRVRHTLARLSTNHGFPQEGDGWVHVRGQPPLRGWSGRRWKEAYRVFRGLSTEPGNSEG